jgi:hypothetical protein
VGDMSISCVYWGPKDQIEGACLSVSVGRNWPRMISVSRRRESLISQSTFKEP